MADKQHKREETVQNLRQLDVLVDQGMGRADAIRAVRNEAPARHWFKCSAE
ncbi:MAG: hypothetical protein QNJ16_06935 [Rhodobacter sp.]|nr:hypothetical protein [Rhodobacter sp.]